MSPDPDTRAEHIFDRAVELPEEDRRPFVAAATAGDPALKRRVWSLLEADRRATGFLEAPGSAEAAPAVDESGLELGPYRLERLVEHGGMGSVYRAVRSDDEYRREVAIKLLQPGLVSRRRLARFRNERQILAQLEHPYIARLYEGGTAEDGRPYLVMELVDGLPIDAYCRRRALSVSQRLSLFERVCSAVHYAHRNLLVHRDLKPGNILVDRDGRPKLLDFGIAKLLATEEQATPGRTTAEGLRPMTLRYASPEQVRGEAMTTASDVYSLGVLLFELLTGTSPYRMGEGSGFEIGKAICELEPRRPSRAVLEWAEEKETPAEASAKGRQPPLPGYAPQELARRLRGDLDNIVLEALRKEPERRYPSVDRLAADLRRHREDRPVAARPPTLSYRLGKFLRRNRLAAVASGLALAAILAASLGVAVSARLQAERLAVERDKTAAALDFMLSLFSSPDPTRPEGRVIDAAKLLEVGARQALRDSGEPPAVRATLLDVMGQVHLRLGLFGEAAPLLDKGLELRRQAFGDLHPEVLDSLLHLAELRRLQAEFDGADILFQEALTASRRLLPEDDPALAEVFNGLGRLHADRGQFEAAEQWHRDALELLQEAGADPLLTAATLNHLGSLSRTLGHYEDAENEHRQALAIQIDRFGEEHPVVAYTHNALGLVLLRQGRLEEAEAVQQGALETQRRLLGEAHPDTLATINNLALTVQNRGRPEEAAELHRGALRALVPVLGEAHPTLAVSYSNLGSVLVSMGDLAGAEEATRKAVEIRLAAFGEDHPESAVSLHHMANIRHKQDALDEAESYYLKAHRSFVGHLGEDHPQVGVLLMLYGRLLLQARRYEEAEVRLEESHRVLHSALPESHGLRAQVTLDLGVARYRLGKREEGETLMKRSMATALATGGAESRQLQTLRAVYQQVISGPPGKVY